MLNTTCLSRFYLPVHVAVKKDSLLQVLEDQIDQKIAEKLEEQSNDFELYLKRTDDLSLSILGFQFNFLLPLQLEFRKIILGNKVSLTAGVILEWQSYFAISDAEVIKVKSGIKGLKWSRNPRLDFGPIEIPVRRFTERVLNKKLEQLTGEFDLAINRLLSAKLRVNALLDDFYQGLRLEQNNQIQVSGECEKIGFSRIIDENGWIRMDIALYGLLLGFTQDRSGFDIKRTWPKIQQEDKLANNYELKAHAYLGYQAIAQMLMDQLNHADSPLHKYRLKVTDLDVDHITDKLVFSMNLKGSLNGSLIAGFKLRLNKKTGMVNIEDLDLKYKDPSWIQSLGFRWMRKNLQKRIHEGIEDILSRQTPRIPTRIIHLIRKQMQLFGISVILEKSQFRIEMMEFTDQRMTLELNSTGRLQLKCPDLSILKNYFA